mmetsp:Transcript_897/g.947  ORF Transcript_897/g.947 Transcript_897/m.947 type:complete len:267 (-) Transcript_897:100-900(-)
MEIRPKKTFRLAEKTRTWACLNSRQSLDSVCEKYLTRSLLELILSYFTLEEFRTIQLINKRWLQSTYRPLGRLIHQTKERLEALGATCPALDETASPIWDTLVENFHQSIVKARMYKARRNRIISSQLFQTPTTKLICLATSVAKHLRRAMPCTGTQELINWVFSEETGEELDGYRSWDKVSSAQRAEEDLWFNKSDLALTVSDENPYDPVDLLLQWLIHSRQCFELHQEYKETKYGDHQLAICRQKEVLAMATGLTQIKLDRGEL